MTDQRNQQIARRRAGIWLPALLLLLVAACSGSDDDPNPTDTEAALQPTATPTVEGTATAEPPVATATTSLTLEPPRPEPGSSGLGDPYFPNAGNGGYDVEHYLLDLRFDPEINRLEGTVTISARALHDLASFNLDFMGMEVARVAVNGAVAEFERDGQELIISPQQPLREGSRFEVIVSYGGFPEPIRSVFGDRVGWNGTDDGAFVLSEPIGAPSWYPVNDHPLDKASYTFQITVPEGLEVAANGLLVDQSTEDGWTTWTYDAPSPMASYLATVNVGKFVFEEQPNPGGVPIRNAFDASFQSSARKPFERTPEMLELFESLFGPYPFEVYGVAVLDFDWGGVALETQTLSIFDRNIARGDRNYEATAAHELAHQWFGNSVSPASWRDIWLNEGFATYAQMIWTEKAEGISVDEQVRRIYHQSASRYTDPPPGDPGAERMFAGSVYYRGAFTLHALRRTVGDDLFFETLRTYIERYSGGNASTEDFIAVAEEVTGEDLDALFDAWLYDEEMPALPD